jgi:hypothetical protein
MFSLKNIVMAGALALASILPASLAEATPMAPQALSVEKNSDVIDARIVCGYWGCHHRYWGPRVVVRPRLWVAPRVVVVGPRWRWGWCGPRWHHYRCHVRY